jgi:hypothetical protein
MQNVMVKQATAGGAKSGRALRAFEGFYGCGPARFNRTRRNCYFENKTLRKIKGQHWSNAATHLCDQDGEAYLVRLVKNCQDDYRRTFVGKFLLTSRKN